MIFGEKYVILRDGNLYQQFKEMSILLTMSLDMFFSTLDAQTTGAHKTAVGSNALSVYTKDHGTIFAQTTGTVNTAVGSKALTLNIKENGTVFVNKKLASNIDIKFNSKETNSKEISLERISNGIWTISNWLTKETCDRLIISMDEWIEHQKMFTFRTGKYKFYNNLHDSKDIADLFYNEIQKYLPETYIDADNKLWQFVGANPIIPWAMYNEGEEFGIHKDTAVVHSNGEDKMTCLIYLNDDFIGGETIFFENAKENIVQSTSLRVIQPEQGKALLFDIDLYHSGAKILKGKKYWVGFELICARDA